MSKVKKIFFASTIVGAVGLSYALYTLKYLPDAFDWDNDDEE
jgi:hypothetical protein